jgi:hypothetical protein
VIVPAASVCRKNPFTSERPTSRELCIETSHQTDLLTAVISAAIAYRKRADTSEILVVTVHSTNFGIHRASRNVKVAEGRTASFHEQTLRIWMMLMPVQHEAAVCA